MQTRFRKSTFVLAGLTLAVGFGALPAHATQYGFSDSFLDTLTLPGPTAVDIGERTAFTGPGPFPPIGPTPALSGPISMGLIEGQFDYSCSFAAPDCNSPGDGLGTSAAYAASVFDWKWGLLKVISEGPLVAQFVANGGGDTLFPSDVAPNEGITSIDPTGFEGDVFTRQMHIAFNIEGQGITLQPGFKYVFFAMYSAISMSNQVANAGGPAEQAIYETAVVFGPPDQFNGYPAFQLEANELATSRLIPIVPEPSTALLSGLGLVALIARRRVK